MKYLLIISLFLVNCNNANANLEFKRLKNGMVVYPWVINDNALPRAGLGYLGTLLSNSTASNNNLNTASVTTSMNAAIPFNNAFIAIVLDSQSTGYGIAVGTGSTFAATANDLNQVGPATVQIPVNRSNGSSAQVVAIYNSGASQGSNKVYTSDGPMTSDVFDNTIR